MPTQESSALDGFVNEAAAHIRKSDAARPKGAPKFCDIWPAIKKCLQDFEPHLPVWAQWLIEILVAIGSKACPTG